MLVIPGRVKRCDTNPGTQFITPRVGPSGLLFKREIRLIAGADFSR